MLAITLVVLGSSLTVAALTENLEVVIVAPDRTYRVGDIVNATVYVYSEGALADPSNLTVEVDRFPDLPRPLNVVRIATGTYVASFQVYGSDLVGFSNLPGCDSISLVANATLANVTDHDAHVLNVLRPAPLPLEVRLTVTPAQVSPGSPLSISIQVLRDGALRDADFVNLTVASQPIPVVRIGVGNYRASYVVPTSVTSSTSLSIQAQVTIGGNVTWEWTQVQVRIPARLILWYSSEWANNTTYGIALHVANSTGWPVVGADVNLSYEDPCWDSCHVTRWLNGTTDSLGKASFNLTHYVVPFPDPWSFFIPFEGTVTKGSSHLEFSWFASSPPPEWYTLRDVFLEDSLRTFAPGENVVVNFTLGNGWLAPYADAFYSAYTQDRVLVSNRTWVTRLGHFSFGFVMPQEPVTLRVSVNMSGYWIYGGGWVFPTNTSTIHVGKIAVGGITPISVSSPSGSGPVGAFIGFSPYDPSREYPAGSSSWTPLGLSGQTWDEAVSSNATLEYGLVIPRYLPKDETYILVVQVGGFGLLYYSLTSVLYTRIVYIENQPPRASAVLSSNDVVPGEAVRLDASLSSDPDGMVTSYSVDWGDGTQTNWSRTPGAEHAYGAPGLYVVTVRVRDDSGAVNASSYAVRTESTTLGVRSSIFWAGAGMVGTALLVVAVFVIRQRRRGPPATAPPSPEAPPPPGPT